MFSPTQTLARRDAPLPKASFSRRSDPQRTWKRTLRVFTCCGL